MSGRALLRTDLPASIVVFLVALPLCLGVALASDAPLLSGIVSGIIGGVVVGLLSGSRTSISGPAAGLTTVVVSAIEMLGSYERFLLALLLAGAMQVVAGVFRAGFVASYIPSSVMKGLLAAIGIILIGKELPYAVGLQPENLQALSGVSLPVYMRQWASGWHGGSLWIGFVSLLLLAYWKKLPVARFRYLPAPLVVVMLGWVCNTLFGAVFPALYIGAERLVALPESGFVKEAFNSPEWSALANGRVWSVAVSMFLIASLETLLNLEATENMAKRVPKASPHRELWAQGIGNMLAALAGGIPITSVIARSSANIDAGAQSRISAILHGVWLLLSVWLLSRYINMIPLASLAAILIYTGYKLTKVSLYVNMFRKGVEQFVPFVVTVVAIIFSDLLTGVLIGLAISIFFLLRGTYKSQFFLQKTSDSAGVVSATLVLPAQLSFLHKQKIAQLLAEIPDNSRMLIDASHCEYIDADVMEMLEHFEKISAGSRNIRLSIIRRESL